MASLAAASLISGAAMAEPRPAVLVELFTSQGCPNCPPADALLEELAARPDVLALALHVDVWDYIGWADTFGRPEHTARQRAYAAQAGEHRIYTPQMVVGGLDHVVGVKPMKLAAFIEAHRALAPAVEIEAEIEGGLLKLKASPEDGARLPARINLDLVGFAERADVTIEHGENAGHTITYANIVERWDRLGEWDGRDRFEITAPVPEAGALAVVVQEAGPGRVLGALRLR